MALYRNKNGMYRLDTVFHPDEREEATKRMQQEIGKGDLFEGYYEVKSCMQECGYMEWTNQRHCRSGQCPYNIEMGQIQIGRQNCPSFGSGPVNQK